MTFPPPGAKPTGAGATVCPFCGTGDDLSAAVDAEARYFHCAGRGPHHPYGWSFPLNTTAIQQAARTGLGAELGVYDDLADLVSDTAPFLEHGIVEHRYALAHPATYGTFVDRFLHTALGPTQYSVSSFLGRALATLWREGVFMHRWVKATGFWSYNSEISAWARPPGPADPDDVLSWAEFAAAEGLDPASWPVLSR